jgi:hypothetical protein
MQGNQITAIAITKAPVTRCHVVIVVSGCLRLCLSSAIKFRPKWRSEFATIYRRVNKSVAITSCVGFTSLY